MKSIFALISAIILILNTTGISAAGTDADGNPLIHRSAEQAEDDFRALWVSTVLNLDFPSKKGISVDEMKKETDKIVARAKELGLNAIVFQVRPAADAMYKSEIFPWSEYLSGTPGNAPANGFDPLAYWIDRAHANGLELHAWINPYRVSHSAAKRANVSTLASASPARQNPSWVVAYENGLYFDPGLPETKKLVIDGIAELVKNYDIDGIHLDDYFYPGPSFNDDTTYKKYGNGMNRDDWRRQNVNELVKGIQAKIKELNPDVRFGISPFAIWQNKASSTLGSDTNGYEAYKSSYSDTRLWVKEGWLDYIAPQIYWYIGFDKADYKKLLNWWEDICRGTGVDLYIGLAAYREAAKEAKWDGEIVRQLKLNESSDVVKGVLYFRYGSITGNVGEQIKSYYATKDLAAESAVKYNPSFVIEGLKLSQPSANISTTASNYYISGTCMPDKELYLNGALVTERTKEGFFGVYLALKDGENKLTLTQEGQQSVSRTITKKEPSVTKPGTSTPVTVKNADPDKPQYATVTADSAWLYPNYSTSGGSSVLLVKGQRDIVSATLSDGKWIKLGCGMWIEKANVSIANESKISALSLSNAAHKINGNVEFFTWKASSFPAAKLDYNGKTLSVSFGTAVNAPPLVTPSANSVFASVEAQNSQGVSSYEFRLKEGKTLEGYYFSYSDGVLTLNALTKKQLKGGDKPLTGFKIVLDAGHGGSDTGALGPLGAALPEKVLNLIYAEKVAAGLEALGATVIKLRDSDTAYSLYQRIELSRNEKPDFFLSIHGNSIDATANIAKINGLTVWYRNENSKALASKLMSGLQDINPLTNRIKSPSQSNLYVCRPTWAPSVIIETSFLCNINDFAWLLNEKNQDKFAERVVNTIIEYYK